MLFGSRLKIKSVIVWVSLLLFTLMIMLPPIIYKYVYPNSGEDFTYHLFIVKNNDFFNQMYFGYILDYPIKWFSNAELAFMWSYYIVILGVGYSIYFVLNRLVNWISGLIGIAFCLIMTVGIWLPFSYGEIYNVINMGIFFPFILYFGFKWLQERKAWQLIGFYIIELLFALCHTSGIYLIPLIGIGGFIYVVAQKIEKKPLDKQIMNNGMLSLLISLVCTYWLYHKTLREWSNVLSDVWKIQITLVYQFKTISPLILVGIVIVILVSTFNRKLKEIFHKNILLFGLMILDAVLYIAGLGLSPQNGRQYYDFTIVWGLTGAVIIGMYIQKNWNDVMPVLLIALVVWGTVSNFQMWTRYNNAVTDADKEAISYVNSLAGNTYITNSNVSLYIYNTFLNKKYDADSNILITRNEPESGSCTVGGSEYKPHGINSTDGYNLLKVFESRGVIVDVYKK